MAGDKLCIKVYFMFLCQNAKLNPRATPYLTHLISSTAGITDWARIFLFSHVKLRN